MSNKIKFAIILAAAAYCVYYFAVLGQWHFIDNVNLIIHEAGHAIFSPFGMFITVAGGSILQLLVPAVFAGYFFKTEQKYSALFVMLWVAINFFSVGWYAADGAAQVLPLLGGEDVIHDWNYLLGSLKLLPQVKLVAGFIYSLGFIVIAATVYLGYVFTYLDKPKQPDEFLLEQLGNK